MRSAPDTSERRGDLLRARAAAHLEEIGRITAEMLDDIHCGHGETRAVDETGNVAVQLDVIQVELARFDFQWRVVFK